MASAYREGVAEHLPDAQITFDRFHLVKLMGEAVDQVRRSERAEHKDLLAKSRYLWLRRPESLSARQRERLDALLAAPLATARAYRGRLSFDAIFDLPLAAAPALERWRAGAMRSRLEPIKKFARTVAEHRDGILRWWSTKISNGLLLGLHSLVREAKRRARGRERSAPSSLSRGAPIASVHPRLARQARQARGKWLRAFFPQQPATFAEAALRRAPS